MVCTDFLLYNIGEAYGDDFVCASFSEDPKIINMDCPAMYLGDLLVIPALFFLMWFAFWLVQIVFTRNQYENLPNEIPAIKQNMTLEELRQYKGTGADKRILIGLNGNIYDVTQGSHVYGPGMPCEMFAGENTTQSDFEKILSYTYPFVGKIITHKPKFDTSELEECIHEQINPARMNALQPEIEVYGASLQLSQSIQARDAIAETAKIHLAANEQDTNESDDQIAIKTGCCTEFCDASDECPSLSDDTDV